MRAGFVTIYSWRPHVEHLVYLANLLESAGSDVFFMMCDADLPTCYTRNLRPNRNRLLECNLCKMGNVQSYRSHNISKIGNLVSDEASSETKRQHNWGGSSASTILRSESDDDYDSLEFAALRKKFDEAAELAYNATCRWIEREKLDVIIAFNGRIDATRGIYEAAKKCGVRYISMERTMFGDGLQLLPDESCLGLKTVHDLVKKWSEKPLTKAQARAAVSALAGRFLKTDMKEWRVYNTSAKEKKWPADGKRRVLLVPGSRNEVWGSDDYADGWPSRTEAYDAVISHLGLDPQDVVVRAHPNWGEKIGQATGILSERYYYDWAKTRGIHYIHSDDDASTLSLIEQADVIVVANGTAALEAGLLGKRIIALAPSIYTKAGFEESAYSKEGIRFIEPIESGSGISKKKIIRQTLRFLYTYKYRIPQFVDFVRCVTPTSYKYYEGANYERIVDLIETGILKPDDSKFSEERFDEDLIVDQIEQKKFSDLMANEDGGAGDALEISVHRRGLYKAADLIRPYLKHGDR